MPLLASSPHRLSGKLVFLVDQEASVANLLKDSFSSEGYRIAPAIDGPGRAESIARTQPDLIILDSVALCRELRQRGVTASIIILTSRSHERDKVAGLKAGADDYLTEPFSILELLARAEATLRRTHPGADQIFAFGEMWVDFASFEARKKSGAQVFLSPLEFEILRYLVENRGRVIRRSEMLQQVWGYDSTTHTRTVDTHIANLRQKIGDDPSDPRYIVTIHGIGYRFKA